MTRILEYAREVAVILAILTLPGMSIYLAPKLARALDAITATPGMVQNEVANARMVLAREIRVTRKEIADTRDQLIPEIRQTREVAAGLADRALGLADLHLGEVESTIQEQLLVTNASIKELVGVRNDLQPVLEEARATLFALDRGITLLTPQTLGLVAGWKVTGGESAQAARRFDAAMPELIAGLNRIVANSDRSTQATAELMGNLAKATKPLPAWMRLSLAIAPPAVQVGASIVTTMAVTGR